MAYRTLIVDGSYLIRRPWEAGGRDSCIGGSIGVILDLRERYSPERIYLCWEGPPGAASHRGRENRQAVDGDYKARRSPWPPELLQLADDLRRIYSQIGCHDGWCEDEADDAAAALVAHELGPHLLWSADKDWHQMIGPTTHLLRDHRGADREPITETTIVARTGLTARGWSDYLALAGDAADGIVGVPRVGDRRARAILAAVPGIVDLALDPLQPAGEGRERAMAQAARTDASIVAWVAWVFEHATHLGRSASLVALRPDSPRTVVPPSPAPEAAAEWLAAQGLPHAARRVSAAVALDPWEDLPF